MSSWSQRRKHLYISVAVVIIVVPAAFISYQKFYHVPTCSDGIQNGGEQGVDCGGSCQKLCASAFLPPGPPVWVRTERVAPGIYNAAAYIENPNPEAGALNVPYHIVLYDASGMKIADVPGTVNLPPHRNTLAFVPAIHLGKAPAGATFEFTAGPDWNKQKDPLTALVIGEKRFAVDGDTSSLLVTLKNGSVQPLPRLSVYSILYDGGSNAIGFSKTVVDPLAGNASVQAPFTWSSSFDGTVISQEILPVAE